MKYLRTVLYEYISPDNQDILISNCYHTKEPLIVLKSYEIKLLHKDNAINIPVLLSLRLGKYKGKKACIGTIHYSEEICAKIENSIRENRSMLGAILKKSPVSQFVIDTNHLIMYWNETLSVFSGIFPSEVLGTSDQWRAFYPDARPCIVVLFLDVKIGDLNTWYEGNAKPSPFIKDAWSSTGFFSQLGKYGKWLHFTGSSLCI